MTTAVEKQVFKSQIDRNYTPELVEPNNLKYWALLQTIVDRRVKRESYSIPGSQVSYYRRTARTFQAAACYAMVPARGQYV